MTKESDESFYARYEAARKRVEAILSDAESVERALVVGLARENAGTAFGREHGFDRVRDLDDYRAAVPIVEYDALSPWIERAANGEANVLTAEPPVTFRRTSGTTGASKKIPATRKGIDEHLVLRYESWGTAMLPYQDVWRDLDGILNLTLNPRPPEHPKTAGGIPWQPFSESFADELRAGGRLYGFPGTLSPCYDPGRVVSAGALRYYRLRRAIEMDNIRAIIAVNPSTVTALADDLRSNAGRVVDEIARGTALDEPCGPPNPERAKKIAKILSGPFRFKDIWPELRFVRTWKSASCRLYLPRVQEVSGDDVDILPFPYLASEGFHFSQVEPHPTGGYATPLGCFYEFVPADRDSITGGDTLLTRELEVGKDYFMVITTLCGLYRYAVGDIIRVLDKDRGGMPRLEFVGRRGAFSSFTGEKLTEEHVIAAAGAAFRRLDLHVLSYTACPIWGDPPYYEFVVETEEALSPAKADALAVALDEAIDEANDEWESKRKTNRLAPVRVRPVPLGTFARYRDRLAAEKSIAVAQIKDVPLQKKGADAVERLLAASRATSSSVRPQH